MPDQMERIERGIDKFLRIVWDIIWITILTAILTVGFWYAMTTIAVWMETRGF